MFEAWAPQAMHQGTLLSSLRDLVPLLPLTPRTCVRGCILLPLRDWDGVGSRSGTLARAEPQRLKPGAVVDAELARVELVPFPVLGGLALACFYLEMRLPHLFDFAQRKVGTTGLATQLHGKTTGRRYPPFERRKGWGSLSSDNSRVGQRVHRQ